MSREFDLPQLLALVPEIYRSRDAAFESDGGGGPLRGLLELLAGQIGVLEESLDRAYDDLFIETCAPELVAYIGDLVGYAAPPGMAALSERAHVAHLVASRRRKGSLAMLEQLARDTTGWGARVVEYRERTATTQSMRRASVAPVVADVRANVSAAASDAVLSATYHGASVRTMAQGGPYTPLGVGVHLWRLRGYRATNVPATAARRHGPRAYHFHPAGVDTPLFTSATTPDAFARAPDNGDIAYPITIERLARERSRLCGAGRAISIVADGRTIEPDRIDVRSLAGDREQWGIAHEDRYTIDPERGRLVVPERREALRAIDVSFTYGFSADVGGGSYARRTVPPPAVDYIPVSTQAELEGALGALRGDTIVEIVNSRAFALTGSIAVPTNAHLTVRAIDGERPLIVPAHDVEISGSDGARCTLSGLLVTSGPLRFTNRFDTIVVEDCTILSEAQTAGRAALSLGPAIARVFVTRCIIGALHAHPDAEITITSTIVDAGSTDASAICAGPGPAGELIVAGSTIRGTIETTLLRAASNSLFCGAVRSERFADGDVRYCYVAHASQTPPMYACIEASDGVEALRFESLRYGDPAYAVLARGTPQAILTGADDGGELGAFHSARRTEREHALRAMLADAVPDGLDVNLFFVT